MSKSRKSQVVKTPKLPTKKVKANSSNRLIRAMNKKLKKMR